MTIAIRSKFSRFVTMFLVLVTMFSALGVNALAASNVCPFISGTPTETKTFIVKTGSRWIFKDKITLTQTKGVARYRSWTGPHKNHTSYACYVVTYSKLDDNGRVVSTNSKSFTGANCTIKMDRNSTYRVTVRQYSADYYTFRAHPTWGAFEEWVRTGRWTVTKTRGINLCS